MLTRLQGGLVKNAPTMLKLPLSLMPFSLQRRGLTIVLSRLFGEAIDDGDFDFLEGRWLEIHISDLALKWFISFDNDQLVIQPDAPQVDVRFIANGDDLLLIAARKEDPDTLFFQRRLRIEGDTELGLEVKNLIDSVELDRLPGLMNKAVDYSANLIIAHR